MKVDRDLLHLYHIMDAGDAIVDFTQAGKEAFMDDRMVRDAVVRNLEIIGEAAKRLSEELRAQENDVPWRSISGLRDVVIHQYDHVDYDEVWNVVEDDLPDLLDEVRRIVGRKVREQAN